MRVEEFSTGWSRTKDYVGRCEFVTENGASGTDSRSLTFVTGPCGVFAVVEDDGQTQSVHYVLKDNLGSWSVVTDGDGNVEQRLSYDAWGNPLRFIDPTGYYVTYGGGHKPDGPLQQVVMDGHVGFVLPEVTVTAYENPINHFEFTYEPNMKCLFNYCFYRIALFYKKRMPLEDYITQGHTVLVSAICFYCIALLNLVLFFVGYKLTKEIVIVLLIPFCIIILLNAQIFPNSKQLFEKMEKELGRTRKGNVLMKNILFNLILLFILLASCNTHTKKSIVENKVLDISLNLYPSELSSFPIYTIKIQNDSMLIYKYDWSDNWANDAWGCTLMVDNQVYYKDNNYSIDRTPMEIKLLIEYIISISPIQIELYSFS